MKFIVLCVSVVWLSSCATGPAGPTSRVWPDQQRSWGQYQADDRDCREYAASQQGGSSSTTKSAAVGAATMGGLGAVSGALIGAGTGRAGAGAAIGAGTGLTAGAMGGLLSNRLGDPQAQQRYNHAYEVCMHARHHHVPGAPRR